MSALQKARSTAADTRSARALQNESGFSLMEMLVVTAVTVTTLGLTLTALKGAREISVLGSQAFETNHNLRAGMTFMLRDLLQTGNGVPTGGIPIPFGGGAVNRPGPTPLQFSPDAVLQAITPGAGLGPLVSGQSTDLVTILYADRSIALADFPLVSITGGGAVATVDDRTDLSGPNGVRQGDLIMFSNAQGNAIQAVTSVNAQTLRFDAGDAFNLNQQNVQGSITQLLTAPVPPTTITRLTMVTYYLDTTTNPQLPRLVRQRNFDLPRTVALVIDGLQVTYDLIDGSPTINPQLINIDRPPVGSTAAQIRKVNLMLAARSASQDSSRPRTFRTNLTTQVSLRSLAFVDRYR